MELQGPKDVAKVEGMFEELDYPMDVIWLDIEHLKWETLLDMGQKCFPDPIEMQKNVGAHGRRMVTIVDPHISVTPDGAPTMKRRHWAITLGIKMEMIMTDGAGQLYLLP